MAVYEAGVDYLCKMAEKDIYEDFLAANLTDGEEIDFAANKEMIHASNFEVFWDRNVLFKIELIA